MKILVVLYMVGLTVALPFLREPPKLSYSKEYVYQNGEVYTYGLKVDTAFSPIENNNVEVLKDIVKFHPVSIPPPPELPPFDYSTLKKQKAQKPRSKNSIDLDIERFIKLMKSIQKNVEAIKKESKPIENFKSGETVLPVEQPKSAKDTGVYIEEPVCLEEHKSVEEPTPIKQSIYINNPNSIDESKSVEESKFVEEPIPTEESIYVDEVKYVEEPKSVEETKSIEETKSVDEPKSTEELKSAEEPKSAEKPKSAEESKSAEEPKSAEKPKSAEESKSAEEPLSVERPKPIEHLDSSKVETKDEPLEDIPVVIQFTIPTTSFLSSLISKLPSLPSFSWPFHLPSFFSLPRAIYPIYNIDDDIHPY